jgi:hypothetical protein
MEDEDQEVASQMASGHIYLSGERPSASVRAAVERRMTAAENYRPRSSTGKFAFVVCVGLGLASTALSVAALAYALYADSSQNRVNNPFAAIGVVDGAIMSGIAFLVAVCFFVAAARRRVGR